jgi:hypothetical protein
MTGKPWTYPERKKLRELWHKMPSDEIGKILGRTSHAVRTYAHVLHLPHYSHGVIAKFWEPTADEWLAIATKQAIAANVKPSKLLAGCRTKKACVARWKAWKEILASNDNYSIAGVARVAGYDHSSVIHGVRRLESMGAA